MNRFNQPIFSSKSPANLHFHYKISKIKYIFVDAFTKDLTGRLAFPGRSFSNLIVDKPILNPLQSITVSVLF
jgi:hypothetical protein